MDEKSLLIKELEELRAFKKTYESSALNRAFGRLQQLVDLAAHDPVMSIRAFRVVAECLVCLREEVEKMK